MRTQRNPAYQIRRFPAERKEKKPSRQLHSPIHFLSTSEYFKSRIWIRPRSQSSLSRSPVYWAVPVLVEVLLRSESSSWMIPLEALSATSRAQSAKTIFSACSNPNVKPDA